MKINKNFKMGLVVGLLMLAIPACGRGTVTSILPETNYGSCGTMTGTSTYTGNIVTCQDGGYCNPNDTVMSGTLTLSAIVTGGLVSGQASITGSLNVNGSSFCCTSQGLAYVGMPNSEESISGAQYILQGVTLICQPTNAGSYQSVTLRLGVGVYAPWTMLTTDQKFVGDFEILSGVNFGGSSGSLYFFAE